MIEWWIIIGLPVLIIALLANAWEIHKWHKFQRQKLPELKSTENKLAEVEASINRLLPLFEAVLERLQAQQIEKPPPPQENNVLHLQPPVVRLRPVDKSE